MKNLYLISYDIENTPLRTKIAKLLIKAGFHRIQYSVFMGTVSTSALKRFKTALNRLQKNETWTADDSIMILPLHQYSKENISFLGPKPLRWDEISGNIHTLVL